MSYAHEKLINSRVMIASGMNRSGSTLLYNLLRVAMDNETWSQKIRLLFGKKLRFECGYIDDLDKLRDADLYLIKTHRLTSRLVEQVESIFYSFRDVRETLVSQHIKFGTELSIDFIEKQIQSFNDAKESGAKMFSYEDLCNNTKEVAKSIGVELGIDINPGRLTSRLPAHRVKRTLSGGYDSKTRLVSRIGGFESARVAFQAGDIGRFPSFLLI